MTTFNDARIRRANDRPVNAHGKYVLYWAQMFRRLHANHALDYALHLCRTYKKPLVVYEALKLNYPWAAERHHTFILQGMRDNAAAAKRLGVSYWPFVETPENPGHGLVRVVAKDACAVVTDDYPAFIVPAHNRAVAAKLDAPVIVVDGNSVVPLSLLGPAVGAAAHLRPRIHKLFVEAWAHRSHHEPDVPKVAKGQLDAPFEVWEVPILPSPLEGEGGSRSEPGEGKKRVPLTPNPSPSRGEGRKPPDPIAAFVASLPLDRTVPAVPGAEGGTAAGRRVLREFITKKLGKYGTERNQPDDPTANAASGLSAYLHYGHLSIQEITEAVLGDDWTPAEINPKTRNKDDFFCRDANVNGFLDEAITWRDVGYQWHFRNAERGAGSAEPKTKADKAARDSELQNVSWQSSSSSSVPSSALPVPRLEVPQFNFECFDFSPGGERTLDVVLPAWAKATLGKHAADRREFTYSLEEFEAGATHDELWNAAQRELVATGRIHNYLRMVWGKKVLEWSASPAAAYRVLEHLNNKYAIDGRDPNSYTGIHWCFGLFDRPWAPERPVFGSVRFMSSDNTAKKFKLAGYYDYVSRLPTIQQVRAGQTEAPPKTLF